MRYYVKVNGNVLEETYAAEEIQGYAPAWREYQADVEVADSPTGPFATLALFLGEAESPVPPFPEPAAPVIAPPASAPPIRTEPPPAAPGQHDPFAALQNFQSSAQQMAAALPDAEPAVPPTRNGMARIGVVLSLFGLMIVAFSPKFGLLLAVAGIITSFIGFKHVKDEPAIYGGKSLAMNGMVSGGIGLTISLLILALLSAKQKAISAAFAPNALREIETAQMVYRHTPLGQGNYAKSLLDLRQKDLLTPEVANLETTPHNGFKVENLETSEKSGNKEARYSLNLIPVNDDGTPRSGDYSYFLDESGIIRRSEKTDELANASSPELKGEPLNTLNIGKGEMERIEKKAKD